VDAIGGTSQGAFMGGLFAQVGLLAARRVPASRATTASCCVLPLAGHHRILLCPAPGWPPPHPAVSCPWCRLTVSFSRESIVLHAPCAAPCMAPAVPCCTPRYWPCTALSCVVRSARVACCLSPWCAARDPRLLYSYRDVLGSTEQQHPWMSPCPPFCLPRPGFSRGGLALASGTPHLVLPCTSSPVACTGLLQLIRGQPADSRDVVYRRGCRTTYCRGWCGSTRRAWAARGTCWQISLSPSCPSSAATPSTPPCSR
jgi:hypothetical protein